MLFNIVNLKFDMIEKKANFHFQNNYSDDMEKSFKKVLFKNYYNYILS